MQQVGPLLQTGAAVAAEDAPQEPSLGASTYRLLLELKEGPSRAPNAYCPPAAAVVVAKTEERIDSAERSPEAPPASRRVCIDGASDKTKEEGGPLLPDLRIHHSVKAAAAAPAGDKESIKAVCPLAAFGLSLSAATLQLQSICI